MNACTGMCVCRQYISIFCVSLPNLSSRSYNNLFVVSSGQKAQSTIERIISVWEERRVYDIAYLRYLRQCLGKTIVSLSRFEVGDCCLCL